MNELDNLKRAMFVYLLHKGDGVSIAFNPTCEGLVVPEHMRSNVLDFSGHKIQGDTLIVVDAGVKSDLVFNGAVVSVFIPWQSVFFVFSEKNKLFFGDEALHTESKLVVTRTPPPPTKPYGLRVVK